MKDGSFYRVIFATLILFFPLYGYSQKLEVVDFYEDFGRLDAVREPVKDLNGTPCGLIRLGLVHSVVEFEGDIMKSEYRNCEWYIWMAEGARYIVIKASGYLPLSYDFAEPIKSKTTYMMTVTKPTLGKKNYFFSYVVPGLGQIEFGKKLEGYTTIVSESLLLGGGIISSVYANKQLAIMRDVDVSLEDYLSAKDKYTTFRAINITCYVAAAALYGFHLFRVYHLSKKERKNRYASLSPTFMSTDESLFCGLSLNINL